MQRIATKWIFRTMKIGKKQSHVEVYLISSTCVNMGEIRICMQTFQYTLQDYVQCNSKRSQISTNLISVDGLLSKKNSPKKTISGTSELKKEMIQYAIFYLYQINDNDCWTISTRFFTGDCFTEILL